MRVAPLLVGLLGLFLFSPVNGADVSAVRKKWHTPYNLYLSPEEAFEMKREMGNQVAFIDVRTRAEVKYVGMANLVDANIPVRFLRDDYAWSEKSSTYRTVENTKFVVAVRRLLSDMKLSEKSPIILMCQSGSRAPVAARLLHRAGFSRVYTQYQGFEGSKAREGANKGKRLVDGWKNAGLPWSYKLDKSKMYFNFHPVDK